MSNLLAWVDGQILPAEEVSIPLTSDSALRGISVFEGIKAYRVPDSDQYCVVSLSQHLARLRQSCEQMYLQVDDLAERVKAGISALLSCDTRDEVYLRPTVYLRSGYYGAKAESHLIVMARSAASDGTPLHCIISKVRHVPKSAYPAQAKIGAMYAFFRLARLEAAHSGADEAILLATDGYVAETPGASIFAIRNRTAHTPRQDNGILPSITRLTAIKLLREHLAIDTVEHDVAPAMLMAADEVFLTGTLDEVRGVSSIDRVVIGNGTALVTNSLRHAYLSACRYGRPAPPPSSAWMTGAPRA